MTAPNEGLSLYDISGFGEDVAIGNGADGKPQKLRVKGISAQGVLLLLMRYPDLQKWLSGQSIAVADVLLQTPGTIAAIIAAGTGAPGDTDAEDIAASLPVETQTDLVEAIYRQTFRSGFGPFVARVLKLYAVAAAENYGRDPGMKSPQELKPSSQPDTTSSESGITPPAK